MKVTHYYKDACRIYWRVEFTESMNGDLPEWDVKVFRSLLEHDDPEAQQVFHTSTPRTGKEVNVPVLVEHMKIYYDDVLNGFSEHLGNLYEPKIEL